LISIIKILVKMENSVWENIHCQCLWNYINLIEKDFVNVYQKLWTRILMYYYKVDHIYPIIVLMWIMYLDRLVFFCLILIYGWWIFKFIYHDYLFIFETIDYCSLLTTLLTIYIYISNIIFKFKTTDNGYLFQYNI